MFAHEMFAHKMFAHKMFVISVKFQACFHNEKILIKKKVCLNFDTLNIHRQKNFSRIMHSWFLWTYCQHAEDNDILLQPVNPRHSLQSNKTLRSDFW